MKYEAPELKIQKFELIEDIMAEGLSGGGFMPSGEDNYDDPSWGGMEETFSTAIRNILDI